jgi:hypothetical protein
MSLTCGWSREFCTSVAYRRAEAASFHCRCKYDCEHTHHPYSEHTTYWLWIHTFLTVNTLFLLWTLSDCEHASSLLWTQKFLTVKTHLPHWTHTFLTVNTHLPDCKHTHFLLWSHTFLTRVIWPLEIFLCPRVYSQIWGVLFQEVPKFRNNIRHCTRYLKRTKKTENYTVI